MSSRDAGGLKAHATSLGGSAPLHRRSPGAPSSTPTPTPTPSARRASALCDSAQHSATSSIVTRPSAGPTAPTAPSAALAPHGADRGDRDSYVSYTSVVDDPFFQRLDLAANLGSGPNNKTFPPRPRDDSNGNGKTQRWPHSRRESLTIGPLPSYWVSSGRAQPHTYAPSAVLRTSYITPPELCSGYQHTTTPARRRGEAGVPGAWTLCL